MTELQPLTDDQLFEFCQQNKSLQIERDASGDLLVMPPTGFLTSVRNSEITMQLRTWADRDRKGVASGSSAGFFLPNGALRAPDAAWTLRSRLRAIPKEQLENFVPLCPDFVIELKSPSDTLSTLQAKMTEYIDNGARLGWLIDPYRRQVHVYRAGRDREILDNPATISGDPELPGFTLDLEPLWNPTI
jgi:Uma2 family endonuclease